MREQDKRELVARAIANCEKLKVLYKQQEEVLNNITKYVNKKRAEIKKKRECLRHNEKELKKLQQ